MDKAIQFNRDRAKEVNKSKTFWYPSEEVEAVFEALSEPREGKRVGKMKKDPWLLDVKIINGIDKSDGKEIRLDNKRRELVLNSKTVIESKFNDIIKQYNQIKGKRFVIIGLGEEEGKEGTYVDYYIDTEENARE
ncbi:MAG: hypothetical protein KatS3mg003_0834 [Candidatus Nitrosocaldaceae archaeon]|nr:MAG: hypothetical protein KatS3mg003_0834 [Candidatus Nitrosocaldaceae archaeon]